MRLLTRKALAFLRHHVRECRYISRIAELMLLNVANECIRRLQKTTTKKMNGRGYSASSSSPHMTCLFAIITTRNCHIFFHKLIHSHSLFFFYPCAHNVWHFFYAHFTWNHKLCEIFQHAPHIRRYRMLWLRRGDIFYLPSIFDGNSTESVCANAFTTKWLVAAE